jgi:hypothetical protein
LILKDFLKIRDFRNEKVGCSIHLSGTNEKFEIANLIVGYFSLGWQQRKRRCTQGL